MTVINQNSISGITSITAASGSVQIFNSDGSSGSLTDLAGINVAGVVTATSYSGTSDTIKFETGGSERARIDSSGRFGLGTTSPGRLLEVSSADDVLIKATSTDAGAYIEFADNSTTQDVRLGAVGNAIAFDVNSERMRIDSSGRLLLGLTTQRSNWNDSGIETKLQIEGAGDDDSAALTIVANSGTTNSDKRTGLLVLGRTRGTAIGSNTAVVQDDSVGMIEFKGADGTSLTTAAYIKAQVDGSIGTDDMPGRLVFATTADGGAIPTDWMRITSSGTLDLYSTDATAWGQFARMVRFGYGNPYKCLMLGGTETASYTSISLGYNVANNASGNFSGDGRDVVINNNTRIISPNSTDDGFLPNIYFNMAGHGTTNFYGGIAFGTDTAAANVLDDYEEGDWTPTWQATTNSGTWAATGRYVKIGRQVTVEVKQTSGSVSWNAQNYIIGGLPFTPSTGTTGAAGVLVNNTPNVHTGVLAWSSSRIYVVGAASNQNGVLVNITYQTDS